MTTVKEEICSGGQGLKTGFPDLDYYCGGLQPGQVYVLAARPSVGKTALAMNILAYLADRGVPVALFSLEQKRNEIIKRIVSTELRQALPRGAGLPATFEAAAERIEHWPLYIDDSSSLTPGELRTRLQDMVARFGIKFAVIDFLQLMAIPGHLIRANRERQVSYVSRTIKGMAGELDLPIMLLSQLNRASELRGFPILADLPESGAIEQDADIVALLHRKRPVDENETTLANPTLPEETQVIIAKNRNGATGRAGLLFTPAWTRFDSMERVDDSEVETYTAGAGLPAGAGQPASTGPGQEEMDF